MKDIVYITRALAEGWAQVQLGGGFEGLEKPANNPPHNSKIPVLVWRITSDDGIIPRGSTEQVQLTLIDHATQCPVIGMTTTLAQALTIVALFSDIP